MIERKSYERDDKSRRDKNKQGMLIQKEGKNADSLELCFLYMYKERSKNNSYRKLYCRLPLLSYFL